MDNEHGYRIRPISKSDLHGKHNPNRGHRHIKHFSPQTRTRKRTPPKSQTVPDPTNPTNTNKHNTSTIRRTPQRPQHHNQNRNPPPNDGNHNPRLCSRRTVQSLCRIWGCLPGLVGLASGIVVGSYCPLTIGCLVDCGPCCLDRAVSLRG